MHFDLLASGLYCILEVTSVFSGSKYSKKNIYQLCCPQHVIVMASRADGSVDYIGFLECICLHHH